MPLYNTCIDFDVIYYKSNQISYLLCVTVSRCATNDLLRLIRAYKMYARNQISKKPVNSYGFDSREYKNFSKVIKALRDLLVVVNTKLISLEKLNKKNVSNGKRNSFPEKR